MPDFSEEKLALRGAAILRRYRHPEDWKEGSETGKPHLMRCKVLKVEELRIGNPPPGFAANNPSEAHLNAKAIRAFGRATRIRPEQLRIEQRLGFAPYVYVPETDWEIVLPLLQALRQ